MVRPVVTDTTSPLKDYEAGVEDFLMAHVRTLKRDPSPPKSEMERRSPDVEQQTVLEKGEKFRRAVLPQLKIKQADRQPVKLSDKYWGGLEAEEFETIGTGPEDPEAISGFVIFDTFIEDDGHTFDQQAFIDHMASTLGIKPAQIEIEEGIGARHAERGTRNSEHGPFTVTTRITAAGTAQIKKLPGQITALNTDHVAEALGVPVYSVGEPLVEMRTKGTHLHELGHVDLLGDMSEIMLEASAEASSSSHLIQVPLTIAAESAAAFDQQAYRSAIAKTLGIPSDEISFIVRGATAPQGVMASPRFDKRTAEEKARADERERQQARAAQILQKRARKHLHTENKVPPFTLVVCFTEQSAGAATALLHTWAQKVRLTLTPEPARPMGLPQL